MLKGLIQAATCFTALLTAYFVYAFLFVPFLEPQRTQLKQSSYVGYSNPDADRRERHRKKLAHLFAANSWELNDPKVLETEHGMLLLKEYTPREDGIVEITPCTMILTKVAREEQAETSAESERPLIIQAPGGAELRFDAPLRIGQSKLGRLIGGQLNGKIRIFSPPSSPQADDGIDIATQQLQIDPSRIWTPHKVHFRYGQNTGSGSDLAIRFIPPRPGTNRPFAFGGVRDLRLSRIDEFRLQIDSGNGLWGGETKPSGPSMDNQERVENLLVTCTGPFRFDFRQSFASIQDQVVVRRLQDVAKPDTLGCDHLMIVFGKKEQDTTKKQTKSSSMPHLRGLKPQRLIAEGHPVRLHSGEMGTNAMGRRLEFDMRTKTAQFDDPEKVTLVHPEERLTIEGKRVIVQPTENKGQLISIVGAGVIRREDPATLVKSQQLHAWLVRKPNPEKPGKTKLTPDRMLAVEDVSLETRQLTAKTQRLEIWIQQAAASLQAPRNSTPALAARQKSDDLGDFLQDDSKEDAFDVQGEHIRLRLLQTGRRLTVDEVTINEQAQFVQTAGAEAGEGIEVYGHRLQVKRASSLDSELKIEGAPARVVAERTMLTGPTINLHRAQNRLWVDGAGRMVVPGKTPTDPPTTIDWVKQMEFDGQRAGFAGETITHSAYHADSGEVLQLAIRGNDLDVFLDQRINFQKIRRDAKVGLQRLAYPGPVDIWNRTTKNAKQQSLDHVTLRNATLNYITGELHGEGPGWVTSAHLGQNFKALSGEPAKPVSVNSPATTNQESKLSFLRIDFEKAIAGNLLKRNLEFQQRVRTVYGPIRHWEEQLQVRRREDLADQMFVMTSDRLSVSELGPSVAGKPAVGMKAHGNAIVEGNQFTARADRISYEHIKDLLILEGDGYRDAEVWLQSKSTPDAAGRRLLYSRRTGEIEVGSLRYIDLSQIGGSGLKFKSSPPPQNQ